MNDDTRWLASLHHEIWRAEVHEGYCLGNGRITSKSISWTIGRKLTTAEFKRLQTLVSNYTIEVYPANGRPGFAVTLFTGGEDTGVKRESIITVEDSHLPEGMISDRVDLLAYLNLLPL